MSHIWEYGTHDICVLFEFYGNAKEDNFLGHRTVSVPLLSSATKESVLLEYGGYKAYIAKQTCRSHAKIQNQASRLGSTSFSSVCRQTEA